MKRKKRTKRKERKKENRGHFMRLSAANALLDRSNKIRSFDEREE